MSTALLTPTLTPVSPGPAVRHPDILVNDSILIPGWVCDQNSYRRWAHSNDYPKSGWVSYLDGAIYIDLNMEELFTHNQVKQAFNVAIGMLLLQTKAGRFVPDRMLFSNFAAGLTTEPDGLYARWTTMQSGLLQFTAGKTGGYVELEGTPDMILEIVSQPSEAKDTVRLRGLYEKARIPEYWLVDARKDAIQFEILRLKDDNYQSVPKEHGWVRSDVFGCDFQLTRDIDPLGQPLFVVNVK